MALQYALNNGVPFTLHSAATTGNGEVVAVPPALKIHTLVIKGSAGIASGAIQWEGSDDPTYAGTWAQIGGGPVTVVASTELILTAEAMYKFMRARISANIVGGTVTVTQTSGGYD